MYNLHRVGESDKEIKMELEKEKEREKYKYKEFTLYIPSTYVQTHIMLLNAV